MLTNSELSIHPHPLIYAYNLQKKIEALKTDIAGMEIEYNQIIIHCREHAIINQDGFAVTTRLSTKRVILPDVFAVEFPEENAILVRRQAAFMGTELDKLVQSHILPSIKVEDAKELVGNRILDKACRFVVSEKVSIVKEDTI